MLDLELSDKNLMVIADERLGVKLGLFYKDPLTTELIKYKSKITKLIIDKATSEELIEFQINYAMQFLTGVREGELSIGKKVISTDEKKKNYNKDWKELLYKKAFKIVHKFAETLLGDYSTYVIKENNLPFPES